ALTSSFSTAPPSGDVQQMAKQAIDDQLQAEAEAQIRLMQGGGGYEGTALTTQGPPGHRSLQEQLLSFKPQTRIAEPCGDFRRGLCTRGDQCRFSHEPPPPPGSELMLRSEALDITDDVLAAAAAAAAAALVQNLPPPEPAEIQG
ncbi:unnamed protein product, partial [Polarella glacialis]